MKIGDLVEIIKPWDICDPIRKHDGKVGIVIEKHHSHYAGTFIFVMTNDGILRLSPYELRLLNDGNR